MKIEDIIWVINKFNILYEDIAWKDDRVRLDIFYQDEKIIMKLYNDMEVLDILELTFSDKERKKYIYYVMRHFISAIGNVKVYHEGNIFYNKRHKEYLRIIVNDHEIEELFREYMKIQEEVQVDKIFVKKLYREIPLGQRKESKRVDDALKQRYEVTRRLFRS